MDIKISGILLCERKKKPDQLWENEATSNKGNYFVILWLGLY